MDNKDRSDHINKNEEILEKKQKIRYWISNFILVRVSNVLLFVSLFLMYLYVFKKIHKETKDANIFLIITIIFLIFNIICFFINYFLLKLKLAKYKKYNLTNKDMLKLKIFNISQFTLIIIGFISFIIQFFINTKQKSLIIWIIFFIITLIISVYGSINYSLFKLSIKYNQKHNI